MHARAFVCGLLFLVVGCAVEASPPIDSEQDPAAGGREDRRTVPDFVRSYRFQYDWVEAPEAGCDLIFTGCEYSAVLYYKDASERTTDWEMPFSGLADWYLDRGERRELQGQWVVIPPEAVASDGKITLRLSVIECDLGRGFSDDEANYGCEVEVHQLEPDGPAWERTIVFTSAGRLHVSVHENT